MSREEMIQKATEMLNEMYYEDIQFFCGMMEKYLLKSGKVRKTAPEEVE